MNDEANFFDGGFCCPCFFSSPCPADFGPTNGIGSEASTPASCIFVPAAAGLIAAGEVVKDIIK